MNISKALLLFNSLLLLLFISSCEKDDPMDSPTPEYQPTELSEDITNLFKTEGNLNADTVWVYEQGGPSGELDVTNLSLFPNYDNYLNVYVHQVLTYNNELYNKELTKEQGEAESDVNTEILHRVIQHYKDQNKTVFVIGHSYGAFVVTQYLSDKGSALADKFVIMAGRLDAEKEFYEGLLNKQFFYFPDFVTPTLHPTTQPQNNKEETELFLTGIISSPRYTEELSNSDLTKLIYVFADDDDALGKLTSAEQAFLVSKNVEIVEIDEGGHGAMFDFPFNQTIYNLMIQ